MGVSHEQKPDLERHVARLLTWAAQAGLWVVRVESEVGSGMDGARVKARCLLGDPAVSTVVVEHRDRFGRMCFAPGLMEALKPGRMGGYACIEEVPG